MKKAIFNKLGTKQLVNTGYKTFDKQTNYIGTGNVIANTMLGFYVRPLTEKLEGVKFDLQHFNNANLTIPSSIKEHLLYNTNRTQSEILYCIFTRDEHGFKDVIGWILTTGHPEYKLVRTSYNYQNNKHNDKRLKAFQEIKKYLIND